MSNSTGDLDALVDNEMSEAAVEAMLRQHGTGVLSMARDGEAYAIPVSFGYDGERCYFVFVGYHEPSTKSAFAEATERATLTVYDDTARDDWHSVNVRGRLVELDEDDWPAAREAIGDNAWYPALFRGADPRGRIDLWGLEVDDLTGYQSD